MVSGRRPSNVFLTPLCARYHILDVSQNDTPASMRKWFAFVLVMVAAVLVWMATIGITAKYLQDPNRYFPVGRIMIVTVVVIALHVAAARLSSVRWTRYVPYLICLALSLSFVVVGLPRYLYASVVLAIVAFCCWKLPVMPAADSYVADGRPLT